MMIFGYIRCPKILKAKTRFILIEKYEKKLLFSINMSYYTLKIVNICKKKLLKIIQTKKNKLLYNAASCLTKIGFFKNL